MNCQFHSLYFSDDGYVVRCKECNNYQIAYLSTILTLNEFDFKALCKLVKYKCTEPDYSCMINSKSIIIQTPSKGCCVIFTRLETLRFNEILEQADSEEQALLLISLFNKTV